MGQDYLPSTESELYTWLNRFMSFAGTNMAALGLAAADMTAIGQAVGSFQGALTANLAAQQAAKQATNAKDTAKASCLAALRSLVRQIQARPAVTDALREGLGIGVKDKNPTLLRAMNDAAMTHRSSPSTAPSTCGISCACGIPMKPAGGDARRTRWASRSGRRSMAQRPPTRPS
jgi:hypothetical protein